MSEPSTRRRSIGPPWAWAAAAATLVLLAGIVLIWRPYLGDERQRVANTPAPAPAVPETRTPVVLPAGGELCMAPVSLTTDGRIAQFMSMRRFERRPRPPLSVRVSGGGHTSTAQLPAGFGGELIQFDVEPPPKATVDGRVCLRNDGRRRSVPLVGSTEVFTQSARPQATVDGAPVEPKVALTFYADDGSVGGHLGDVLDHATAFKPFGPAVLGLVALLLLVGLPIGTIGVLVWALRRS